MSISEVVASASAGCVATVLGHPLDCIKVRMQALQRPGLTTAECALEMVRADGAVAFSRGIGPPLANAVVMNTFMFVAFAEARKALPQNSLGSMLAGLFAGLVTSVCSTPTDFVKIQAQLRGGGVTNRAILGEALRAGPSALFTGQIANMGREGIFTAVYLGLYDAIKRQLLSFSASGSDRLPLHLVAAASATTGALAWVTSYPFDVIKSVQQAQNPAAAGRKGSLVGAFESVWRSAGWRGFYRGVSASTFRAVLVTSSRLIAYEQVKHTFGWK